jgi:hypothetical protein
LQSFGTPQTPAEGTTFLDGNPHIPEARMDKARLITAMIYISDVNNKPEFNRA